jgi:hypothetical protein
MKAVGMDDALVLSENLSSTGKINIVRLILGGLVAGLVMNVSEVLLNAVVLAKDVEAAMQAINQTMPDGGEIMKLIGLTFVVGLITVWLYAAIRPRFGAGAKTALIAGLAVWLLTYFYGSVVNSTMGIFPTNIYVIGGVWELVATLIASLAGCALYKEA